MFNMKFQYKIYGECWDLVKKLLNSKKNAIFTHDGSPKVGAKDVQINTSEQGLNTNFENNAEGIESSNDTLERNSKTGQVKRKRRNLGIQKKRGRAKRVKQDKAVSNNTADTNTSLVSSSDLGSNLQNCDIEECRTFVGEGNLQEVEDLGVPIGIDCEGGHCSAIVALMAIKRITFDIIIPEQMILIDNQKLECDDPDKLLDKIRNHELASGRKFILPPDLERETASPDSPSYDEDIYNERLSNVDLNSFDGKDYLYGNIAPSTSHSQGKSNTVNKSDSKIDYKGGEEEIEGVQTDSSNYQGKEATGDYHNDAKRKIHFDNFEDKAKRLRISFPEELDASTTEDADLTTMVSDLENEESPAEGNHNETEESSKLKPRSKPISKSRIRMYMMKEHMSDLYDNAFQPQWMFDNVFINTCEISCRLRNSPDDQFPSVISSPQDVPKAFMPISQQVVNNALAKRKKVVLKNWIKLEEALNQWKSEGESPEYLEKAEKIYSFIDSTAELGASSKDIKDNFSIINGDSPMKMVSEMENLNLILKVGVDKLRWVTIQHSKAWLIHTNKISRSKINCMESVRLSGVYEVKGSNNNPENDHNSNPVKDDSSYSQKKDAKMENQNKETGEIVSETSEIKRSPSCQTRKSRRIEIQTKGNKFEILSSQDGIPDGSSLEDGDEGRLASSKKSLSANVQHIRPTMALRNIKYRKDTTTMEKVEKAVDHHVATSQHEEIDVLVRPWVRLNGCLNRRVMDRFLGAIHSFIMEKPGVSGLQIANKFWPALQPAHAHELLETLTMIRSVTKSYGVKSHKVSLFSKPQILHHEPADEYDYDENLLYEATVDGILNLSMFIGDKKYTQDFLSTCR